MKTRCIYCGRPAEIGAICEDCAATSMIADYGREDDFNEYDGLGDEDE